MSLTSQEKSIQLPRFWSLFRQDGTTIVGGQTNVGIEYLLDMESLYRPAVLRFHDTLLQPIPNKIQGKTWEQIKAECKLGS